MRIPPETIAFLQAHYRVDMTGAEVAKMLGIQFSTLRNRIAYLRSIGYEFETRAAKIGEVRTVNAKRGAFQKIKTADGWKRVLSEGARKRDPKPKAIIQPRIKPFKPMPRKKTNPNLPSRQEPKPIKRTALTTAEKLECGYVWIQIDSRTKVLRSPDKIKTA